MNYKVISRITNPEEISCIVDFIHDRKFDKSRIVYDSISSTLIIEFDCEVFAESIVLKRFLFVKKIKVPVYKFILKITDVESYIIHESYNGPGSEDFFNRIIYDSQQKIITILTVVDGEIEVRVRKLVISIENTYQIVSEKILTSIFGKIGKERLGSALDSGRGSGSALDR